ncbi:hypothetical protein PRIPAC_96173 [Pristionchus pacificus]|uniref:Uncharacterized protein n=1 Tax=Pristionchus pacificus TaxID=54126 RepID=A0A2A6D2K4_PRIPA|nr:hypothetical protein PRIPAC_96173 [Pristionchus pacificus]|eukprot:PDM84628.1 hypothetical protein PRIPAC_33651 [Pristionchus pacificus]
MQVQSEDITVAWGQQPHHLDQQYGRWRLAVFQDVQEAIDSSKLYFLYDPDADERSMTTGSRKGGASIVVFDLNLRCFVAELPITVFGRRGKPKFLFALKAPASSGGTSFVFVSESEGNGGMYQLHVSRIDLWQDGLSIADNRPLLSQPMNVAGDYICTMREDAPEMVVMANPGLQVWRVDALAAGPSQPNYFTVPGAELRHFYDGFLSMGSVYLLSAFADGNLDYTRVHVLSLENPGQINTHTCHADPARGMPPARQQAAIDSTSGYILVAGGEIDYGGNVQRLSDYWVLDLTSFQWQQVPSSMPIPLIEPRLTTTYSGNVYLWGDFDQPLPGMPHGTHLRILRIRGFGQKAAPPSYDAATSASPYPSVTPSPTYPSQPIAPYPQSAPAHPPAGQNAPAYPSYAPNPAAGYSAPGAMPQQGAYQAPGPSYGGDYPRQDGQGYHAPPGQQAYYPPQEKKKKDCSIM